jgi:hypothetical protein
MVEARNGERLMNLKSKHSRASSVGSQTKLSYAGGGKVSVSVTSIVNSPKVQRQVSVVKEIAASRGGNDKQT